MVKMGQIKVSNKFQKRLHVPKLLRNHDIQDSFNFMLCFKVCCIVQFKQNVLVSKFFTNNSCVSIVLKVCFLWDIMFLVLFLCPSFGFYFYCVLYLLNLFVLHIIQFQITSFKQKCIYLKLVHPKEHETNPPKTCTFKNTYTNWFKLFYYIQNIIMVLLFFFFFVSFFKRK